MYITQKLNYGMLCRCKLNLNQSPIKRSQLLQKNLTPKNAERQKQLKINEDAEIKLKKKRKAEKRAKIKKIQKQALKQEKLEQFQKKILEQEKLEQFQKKI